MERAVRAGKVALSDDGVSTLAIPIKVGDEIVGVVDVRRQKGATEWSREEIELLETLSEQLGVALESARLYQETQRRELRERLVGEISGRFRSTLDVDTILQTAAQDIREALGLSRMTVQLGMEGRDRDREIGIERVT
jgi:transcriptional regulator with GAF, ATPase, and Fis domain